MAGKDPPSSASRGVAGDVELPVNPPPPGLTGFIGDGGELRNLFIISCLPGRDEGGLLPLSGSNLAPSFLTLVVTGSSLGRVSSGLTTRLLA